MAGQPGGRSRVASLPDPFPVYICRPLQKKTRMLIIPVKEGEAIDKALKKFKKKYEKTGVLRALRKRKAYTKPSVSRRKEVLHAVYKNDMFRSEE